MATIPDAIASARIGRRQKAAEQTGVGSTEEIPDGAGSRPRFVARPEVRYLRGPGISPSHAAVLRPAISRGKATMKALRQPGSEPGPEDLEYYAPQNRSRRASAGAAAGDPPLPAFLDDSTRRTDQDADAGHDFFRVARGVPTPDEFSSRLRRAADAHGRRPFSGPHDRDAADRAEDDLHDADAGYPPRRASRSGILGYAAALMLGGIAAGGVAYATLANRPQGLPGWMTPQAVMAVLPSWLAPASDGGLIVENGSGDLDMPLPLGIEAPAGTAGVSVRLSGLPAGARVSPAERAATGEWLVPVSLLRTATVTPPVGFVGTATAGAELLRPDGRVLGRVEVGMTWTPPASAKIAAMTKANGTLRPSDMQISAAAAPAPQAPPAPQARVQVATAAAESPWPAPPAAVPAAPAQAAPAQAASPPPPASAKVQETAPRQETKTEFRPPMQAYASVTPTRPAEPAQDQPRRAESADAAAALKRAETLIASGDVAAARLVLHKIAESGDAHAALLLGGTYDPAALARLGGVHGGLADPVKAREWYEKAKRFGSAEAARRLDAVAARQR